MKRLFAFFVFLSCSTIMWAQSFESEMAVGDTIENKIYELGPEMIEEVLSQKCNAFIDSLILFSIEQNRESRVEIKDSVIINFEVNAYGRVDSVWLVYPKTYPFEKICKFIKSYDFQGPLVEFYTSKPSQYDCTMELGLFLSGETKMLYVQTKLIDTRKKE